MVATLTPPFRLAVGSETRKKAGRADLFSKSAAFVFPRHEPQSSRTTLRDLLG